MLTIYIKLFIKRRKHIANTLLTQWPLLWILKELKTTRKCIQLRYILLMVIVDIYPDYFLHFCDGYAIQIYPAVYLYIRNRNLLLQLIIKISFQYSISANRKFFRAKNTHVHQYAGSNNWRAVSSFLYSSRILQQQRCSSVMTVLGG